MLKTYRLILFNYHKLLLELSTESTVRIWKTFSALQGGGTGGYGRRQQGPPPPHAGGRRTACCVRHTGRSLPARPTAEKCAAPVGMSICRDGVLPQDPGGSPLGDHGSDGRERARETGVRGVEGRRPRLARRGRARGQDPGRGQATTAPRQGPDPLALSFPLPPPRPLCRGASRRWKGPSAHSHASVPCQVLNPELRGPAQDPPCPPHASSVLTDAQNGETREWGACPRLFPQNRTEQTASLDKGLMSTPETQDF